MTYKPRQFHESGYRNGNRRDNFGRKRRQFQNENQKNLEVASIMANGTITKEIIIFLKRRNKGVLVLERTLRP